MRPLHGVSLELCSILSVLFVAGLVDKFNVFAIMRGHGLFISYYRFADWNHDS